ncbi:hypothetical protein [Marinoscillum furvescens]|uniref:Uncharacterized protein n=1 Tax=Marinoscillum furvescens DSM 4134 TaxID=1122208 RepID=A0A3D9L0B7_MARFU|nr:hypothetical protein [Marinoscillum furvescens]RED94417.1 hypothetical protein C7460_121104 [Marinoscillum furvescens DSM 4134]
MQQIANQFRVKDLMFLDADVTFDDDYHLKLTSKKLRSGKCQVKFFASIKERKDMYGYVLVDADKTLKDVVVTIKDKLRTIRQTREFHHLHLYSIGKVGNDDMNFIIFDS